MQPIFEYLDYRCFLKDWYQYAKSHKKGVSFRWFSARAGITSPVFPKLVMDGSRNLGESGIQAFANAMGLEGKERTFWIHLVGFNQAKTSEQKQEHYSVLSELVYTIPEESLGSSAVRYYSHWYLPILRELVVLKDFKNDWSLIAQWIQPSITAKEAETGVQMLLDMGLIKLDTSNRFVQTKKAITSGSPWSRKVLIEFHKSMLQHSAMAIETFPRELRHVSGMTLGVSQPCYEAILAEFEAFRNRVVSLVHRDQKSDRVMHMGFQLIPVGLDPKVGEPS